MDDTHVLSKEEFMEKVRRDHRRKLDKKRQLESDKKDYIMNKLINNSVRRRKHKP